MSKVNVVSNHPPQHIARRYHCSLFSFRISSESGRTPYFLWFHFGGLNLNWWILQIVERNLTSLSLRFQLWDVFWWQSYMPSIGSHLSIFIPMATEPVIIPLSNLSKEPVFGQPCWLPCRINELLKILENTNASRVFGRSLWQPILHECLSIPLEQEWKSISLWFRDSIPCNSNDSTLWVQMIIAQEVGFSNVDTFPHRFCVALYDLCCAMKNETCLWMHSCGRWP